MCRKGGVTGIIGPNGAGKTTLFSLIAGSERASSGRVSFDGVDVTAVAAHGRAKLGIAPHLPDHAAVRRLERA